jgi:tRNA-binding EMAP/Myf-like protein
MGMSTKAVADSTLLIRGKNIPVQHMELEHAKLRFWHDNPRVYSAIRGNGDVPTQEEIQEHLLKMEHVKALIYDIELNGGLIEPLIVRDGTFDVVEGNSRLAAWRALAKKQPLKWGYVKSTLLPSDIDESLIFALLGQYHIKGRKDWVPYEQAGFLYRRYKQHNEQYDTLAIEIGMSSKKVKHLVQTYEFMVDHDQEDISRWSYFDEYLKSGKIKKARKQFPELDKLVVKKIDSGEIARAVDLREQLPVICTAPKVLTKFIAKSLEFTEAYETAVESGGDTGYLKTVKKFRDWVTRPKTQDRLLEADGKIRSSVVFELRKIDTKIQHLLKKLDA